MTGISLLFIKKFDKNTNEKPAFSSRFANNYLAIGNKHFVIQCK